MSVVLTGTRSSGTDESDNYSSGIENYKLADYQHAALDLSDAVLKNKSAIAPRFFLGITQLALGNYDQAVDLLSDVSKQTGEYRKDAEWYLGLAYLKTGEKEKAFACFDLLSKTPGFYRERADKILRHLR
jgi:tetratricopeptide (TPR) repeat protein